MSGFGVGVNVHGYLEPQGNSWGAAHDFDAVALGSTQRVQIPK